MGTNHTMVRLVATAIFAVGLLIAFWIWPEPVVEDREERLLRQGGAILVSLFTFVVVVKAWMETFQRRA